MSNIDPALKYKKILEEKRKGYHILEWIKNESDPWGAWNSIDNEMSVVYWPTDVGGVEAWQVYKGCYKKYIGEKKQFECLLQIHGSEDQLEEFKLIANQLYLKILAGFKLEYKCIGDPVEYKFGRISYNYE